MNGRKTGRLRAIGCPAQPSAQSNNSAKGGLSPCQTLLHRFDLEGEGLVEPVLQAAR